MDLVAQFLADTTTDTMSETLNKKLIDLGFEKKDKNFLYYKETNYGSIVIAVTSVMLQDPLYTISIVVEKKEKKHDSEEDHTIKKTFGVSDSNVNKLIELTINYLKRFING